MNAYSNIAETYDAIRPGYPAALIHDIIHAGNLNQNSALMEIAAGTGKATTNFLTLDCHIDAVELEPSMAELLCKKSTSPLLSVFVSSFEDWQPPQTQYDCIYCAQGFHWLDPQIKFQKTRQYLKPYGLLALFWYDPLPPTDSPAYQASQKVKLDFLGPEDITTSVSMDTRLQELQSCAEFSLFLKKEYSITLKNSPEQALAAMESTPAFQQKFLIRSKQDRQAFCRKYITAIQENGGFLEAPMRYTLFLLKPV